MNSDSENEDDDLFILSATSSRVPPDLAPGGQNGGNSGGEDKLARLRAELEREMRREGEEEEGECEDGGRFMTQLLHVVSEGEEGEEGEGGEQYLNDGKRCVDGGKLTVLGAKKEDETTATAEASPNEANLPGAASNNDPPRDVTDGAMFSRPPPREEREEEEEEEVVVFRGLIPLSCRCYYGREEEMKSLKATAEPVLAQAVALIHSFLGQWTLHLVPTSTSNLPWNDV